MANVNNLLFVHAGKAESSFILCFLLCHYPLFLLQIFYVNSHLYPNLACQALINPSVSWALGTVNIAWCESRAWMIDWDRVQTHLFSLHRGRIAPGWWRGSEEWPPAGSGSLPAVAISTAPMDNFNSFILPLIFVNEPICHNSPNRQRIDERTFMKNKKILAGFLETCNTDCLKAALSNALNSKIFRLLPLAAVWSRQHLKLPSAV